MKLLQSSLKPSLSFKELKPLTLGYKGAIKRQYKLLAEQEVKMEKLKADEKAKLARIKEEKVRVARLEKLRIEDPRLYNEYMIRQYYAQYRRSIN